jgi:DNA-binding transcriptional regulator YdaS (Cro superfamily)
MTPLEKAIQIVGSQAALATALGTTQSRISNWLRRDKSGVPAEYCGKIERLTGGQVSRWQLRPDIEWGFAPPVHPEDRPNPAGSMGRIQGMLQEAAAAGHLPKPRKRA